MNSVNLDMTKYLHSYEAYRIPKEKMSEIKKQGDVNEENGDQLVLTEQAKKQLFQDRADYASAMMEERKKLSAEQNAEAEKKYREDQAKMAAVFRSMSEGKNVSDTDEKKLMEYDPKLYMAAKMAQMMAQRADKEKESHFDPKDEEEYEKKMKMYNEKADQYRESWNSEFSNFLNAQKEAIVEISTGDADISAIRAVVNLGGGITGAVIDEVV